jgi:peptidoglycan/xylan/chitin deacetylase (PgdA/CDA1 family)
VTNPLVTAVKGKSFSNLCRRSLAIGERYGLTIARMDRAIGRFVRILEAFDCSATFPLTASTLAGSTGILKKYHHQGIEFAVHGYQHVDHKRLSLDQQLDHLGKACRIFEAHNLNCHGFRCPYLRWNQDTLKALGKLGFAYDSSQALAWEVVDDFDTEAYHRVLRFYGAQSAADYPALPWMVDNLVRIPYCLPDDEALVDRLQLADAELMSQIWVEVLQRTYELGELFTLGLHPERVSLCGESLRAVLDRARSLSPGVWIARLDDIANWWRGRGETTYRVARVARGSFRLTVDGPPGTTILARSVGVEAPAEPWMDGYQRVLSSKFVFRADRLPFIGLSPDVPSALTGFLRQQGYLVEQGADAQSCTFYLDRSDFAREDERLLLKQVEEGPWPVIRLARWPDGARSALSVTGDIDALTLWDYVSRIFGN